VNALDGSEVELATRTARTPVPDGPVLVRHPSKGFRASPASSGLVRTSSNESANQPPHTEAMKRAERESVYRGISRASRSARHRALCIIACLTMACAGDDPPITGPRTAADMAVVDGDEQQGFPRRPFGDSVRVRVTDSNGDPVSGVRVIWELDPGEGVASPVISTTDADGVAVTEWTAGILATASIRARVGGRDIVAVASAQVSGFTLDCEPGAFEIARGSIRAMSCSAMAIGDFAGVVTLAVANAPTGVEVGFGSGSLDLREVDGPVGTSALLSTGNGTALGTHEIIFTAQSGESIAVDAVRATVR